jgi:hypothetical protein
MPHDWLLRVSLLDSSSQIRTPADEPLFPSRVANKGFSTPKGSRHEPSCLARNMLRLEDMCKATRELPVLAILLTGSTGWFHPLLRAQSSEPTTVAAVIARYRDALGNRTAVDALKIQVKKGTGFGNSAIEVYYAAPDRFCKISYSRRGTYRIGTDGRSGWIQDQDVLKPAGADTILYERLIDDPFLVFRLGDYFPSVRFAGRRVTGKTAVDVLVAAAPDGSDPRLFPREIEFRFDALSGLLAGIGPFQFDDYRLVNGVRVPFTIRMMAGEEEHHSIRYDEIRHNVQVDSSLFRMPESAK